MATTSLLAGYYIASGNLYNNMYVAQTDPVTGKSQFSQPGQLSVYWLTVSWTSVQFPVVAGIFLFTIVFWPVQGPTQPPIIWAPDTLSPEKWPQQ